VTAYGRLTLRDDDGVLVVVMDGGALGLLDGPLIDDLARLVETAEHDPGVRAVVLTGAHPTRFISHADIAMLAQGADEAPALGRPGLSAIGKVAGAAGRSSRVAALTERTPLAGVLRLNRFHQTMTQMNASCVVYVAALNGSALGGGAELAWACDVRVMVDDDTNVIGQPEVLLGFNPGGGATQRLTRLVGTHRALMAMLDGAPMTPREALDIGAVDELAPRADVVARATSWARRLGSRPQAAIAAVKRSVYSGASMPLAAGLHTERTEFMYALASPQARDIMTAYLHATEDAGDLPLYDTATYADALAHGSLPTS
jgi:enoyl-CoA hydratase/carnithine racemase